MKRTSTFSYSRFATESQIAARLVEDHAFHAPATQIDPLGATITRSANALLEKQYEDGYWMFELEADTTIPAEYMLLHEFFGTTDNERNKRFAKYIRSRQLPDGGWPLYEGGPGNISATVKAYFALKLAGEDPASEVMKRARRWVLTHGGAESANVFTRILLAMFGQLPWRTVPAMPTEIIWLPRWFFFSLNRVSYWSRCVIVPLLIIFAKRPVHTLPEQFRVPELFLTPPDRLYNIDKLVRGKPLRNAFILLDRVLKIVEHLIPSKIRNRAVAACEHWTREHMRGEGGNGAIYPAMANAVVALKLLGHGEHDPDMVRGWQAIEDLVLDDENGGEHYVQPCVSPIWDTCLSMSALAESGLPPDHAAIKPAVDWIFSKQILTRGDWSSNAPDLDAGGWAFQFENDFYPDVDDTAMVVMALLRVGAHADAESRRRMALAVNWVIGMQNSDGGWGAFDIDNHHTYLNNIPFADHGALVDPSTPDLAGRCIEMLAMLGYDRSFPPIARGLEYLHNAQQPDGSWFGRWGVNYVYGTWAVLIALGALGEDPNQPYIRKAVTWLKTVQNLDGGWGESCDSYDDKGLHGRGESTASQTAWALLGLMAAGEFGTDAVERGVEWLLHNHHTEGGWKEDEYTGTGFPRVFYLRYHGYRHFFPLWALGVYRRMKLGIPTRQQEICQSGPIDLGQLPVLKKMRWQGMGK